MNLEVNKKFHIVNCSSVLFIPTIFFFLLLQIDLKQEMNIKVCPSSNSAQTPTLREYFIRAIPHNGHRLQINFIFRNFPTRADSDNVLNGNTPPLASQKAFTIIADSLRRIDVSREVLPRCTTTIPKFVKLSTIFS